MSFSVNEIEGLLIKAARGAGAPAAQAAAFGQAGALHIARAGDPNDLQAALNALPHGAIISAPLSVHSALIHGGIIPCDPCDLLRAYVLALPYDVVESATSVEINTYAFKKASRPARIKVADHFLQTWRALAALTYVPETEQSRIGGAGAGLTDND